MVSTKKFEWSLSVEKSLTNKEGEPPVKASSKITMIHQPQMPLMEGVLIKITAESILLTSREGRHLMGTSPLARAAQLIPYL